MKSTPLIIGVTSHRNLLDAEVHRLRLRIRELFACLKKQFPDMPVVVVSALAEGGDRLVADEALACGAQLVAVMPLPESLYLQDFESRASRRHFTRLRQQSTVVHIPLQPRNTQAGIGKQGPQRDAQYAEAGVFISSHCHILLALWDGRDSDLYGGTAQIVRYHIDGILPGVIERRHPARPLLNRGDESLLCHLACSRSDAQRGVLNPRYPLRPLDMRWISQEEDQPFAQGIPAEFDAMFRHMVQFNRDMDRYWPSIEDNDSASPSPSGDFIVRLFHAADWLAIHFQRRVLLAMRGIHVLAALMGIAFVAYSDLPGKLGEQASMIDLFIAFFLSGVILDRVAHHREWHRKYIDYRALAEGLRVQRYWRMAGVEADDSVAFAHDNFMQKQDVELGWIRNVMRSAGLQTASAPDMPSGPHEAIDHAIIEWIGASENGGQLGYYELKCAERSHTVRAARRLGNLCLWAGIALGLVLAVFHRRLDTDTSTYMVAVIGVLAIVAAARESYAYRKADRELIKQYNFMLHLFSSARSSLDGTTDDHARREILRELGDAALAEHAEWALMHRERPLEHGRL